MLTRIADLNPTVVESQTAAAQRWVAADLERGAYLIRCAKPLAVAGDFYSPWFKLMIPAFPWPGGTLTDLQDDVGLYYWRPILDDDLDTAVEAAEKKLAAWFTEEGVTER